ncbi:MAG: branched-chain amino acid ABC transporter permease [Pseudomonadota bacterium]
MPLTASSPAPAGAALSRTRIGVAGLVIVALALAAAPFWLADATLGVLTKALIAALFALAFNLLAGQAGMLSFGHAAYFAIGAFAAVHAMVAVDRGVLWLPTPFIPLAGALAGGLAGAVFGFFATMRSGVYFSMVTLAIAELLYTLAPNLQGFFGGETGISSFRQPFALWSFGSEQHVYTLVLIWTLASAVLLWAYTRSLFGRLTIALRENEKRLPALGYNVHATKILVFAVSGLFSGVAGALLAVSNESANYVLFQLSMSSSVVLTTFIGGSTLFLGPAIGGFLMSLFGHVVSDLTRSWLLYQGVIFIVVMLKAPNGIAQWSLDWVEAIARDSWRAAGRLVLQLLTLALAGLGLVLLCELCATLFARDYAAEVERTGVWPAISVFNRAWLPTSPTTWLMPVALVGAAALVHWSTRRLKVRA